MSSGEEKRTKYIIIVNFDGTEILIDTTDDLTEALDRVDRLDGALKGTDIYRKCVSFIIAPEVEG
jgi:hypothetical protein